MLDFKCVIFLSLGVLKVNSGIVDHIDPCHYNDPDCILKSSNKMIPHFVDGVEEFGISSLNPLHIKEVKNNNGDLKLTFQNILIHNLPKCKITKIERPDKLKLFVELECPITMIGNYSADGKAIIDVYGHGGFEIKTDKVIIKLTVSLKSVTKDGQDYYKFTSFDYSYDTVKKVYITFDNLYDGDKQKAEPFVALLDSNWKEFIDVFGKDIIKEIITLVVEGIGKFISHIPANKLELN